ncbi:NAD-dependent epimerase/dehydratase family protein [Mongoliitalea daihaiensis]|uniref:NAD-dependent epimerase/dehydratase family protein n=1 Tax=Mongoliitalea daihaiensis TaxID=2782006 RepID=UPI001F3E8D26|nr:NAD-dependent epimerase/dehydratase family protein [Mongoliitalea daihaiensis]UJP65789.1 NAD-dependent epimerase/dehydratase family protein [Mongoliitalea daihaiensis]
MKILITGITGVLGSRLAQKFSKLGEIHGLKRPDSSTALLPKDFPVVWHEGDLVDPISVEDALEGIDLVIHAAGLISFDEKDQYQLNKINWEGTGNLVNAMLEKGVKKLIHVSSVAALGKSPEQNLINESQKWVNSPWNTPYAISKYLGDLEVWRAVQEGLQALVVHPSVILTKIADNRSSAQVYDYVLQERKYFPRGTINYIDVRDVVELMYRLYTKDSWNESFILNANSISYKDFFASMATVFGKQAPSKPVDSWMLKVALFAQGIGKMLGFSNSPLNKQTAMMAQLQVTMDNSKVTSVIPFDFTPLEQSFQWARSND